MAIVGVSGSPIVGGNTDRMVKALLEKSGKDHIFINLSTLRYDPCRACAHLCAKTNLCPLEDDLKPYFEPILKAEALVLGTPAHSGNMTGWMFSFISRLWCFHHVKNLLRDKPVVLVMTGLVSKTEKRGVNKFTESLKGGLKGNLHPVKILGHIYYASHIPPCYNCGRGKICKVGGLFYMLDYDEEKLKNFELTCDMFKRWEDCPQTVASVEKYAEMLSHLEVTDTLSDSSRESTVGST